MYDHYPECVAPRGKFRVIGFDNTSSKKGPYVVSDHDSLSDALKERNALIKLVDDLVSIYGLLFYDVYDDRGMERGYVISESQWSHDFFCGIHSGIPLCCVLWYCDMWSNNLCGQFRFSEPIEYEYQPENLGNQLQIKTSQSPGYAMCPDCLANYVAGKIIPIQVKKCMCSEQTIQNKTEQQRNANIVIYEEKMN